MRVMLVGALLMSVTSLGGTQRLAMKVTPAVSIAPANLRVRAMVQANAENRALEIVAESPDFYRSSRIQLDGEQAPHANIIDFRDVPSGTYEVTASLIDADDHRTIVRQGVTVIGGVFDR